MPTPIETVTAFLAEFSRGNDGMLDAIRERFLPTTVWENVGLAITTGPDEAIALCRTLEASSGMHDVQIDILAIAADGDTVLTERIDRMIDTDGIEYAAFKVMGTFEVDGEKIAAWRDYFDSAAAKEGMSGGGA